MRSLFLRLALPLGGAAIVAFCLSFWVPSPWRDLLINLTAGFVGAVITVFYVEHVIRANQEREWKKVKDGSQRRIHALSNKTILSVRTAFHIRLSRSHDVSFRTGNPETMRKAAIDLTQELLGCLDAGALKTLTQRDWKTLIANLEFISVQIDQMLMLFGVRLEPVTYEFMLHMQWTIEGISGFYAIWPDMLGVSDEALPRKKNGESSIDVRDSAIDVERNSLAKLLHQNLGLLNSLRLDEVS
jgi:hypothetical protein